MTAPAASWRDNLRADLPASLVVFLVALPLCLGVALASGAPLVAGLIAGVIGGLVVAPLSGSNLMVSGPAAGLTAVVLSAIGRLGGFDVFLTAVVLAGAMQLGFGLAKAGFIAKYFPSSVIKGMLAAIGITLVLKQVPHAMGYDAEAMGLEQFQAVGNENTFTSITHLAGRINPTAVVLSVVSLLILFLWDNPRFKGLKRVPAALVVVLLGTIANELIVRFWPALQLAGDELVQVPVGGVAAYVGEVTLPRWDVLLQPQVWVVAATIALVASLETLLSLEATDKLDPLKRHSSADRELRAQGIGNFLAGMVGGLPLTGVIVRSAANIESGRPHPHQRHRPLGVAAARHAAHSRRAQSHAARGTRGHPHSCRLEAGAPDAPAARPGASAATSSSRSPSPSSRSSSPTSWWASSSACSSARSSF